MCVKRTRGSPRRLPRECSREIVQCSREIFQCSRKLFQRLLHHRTQTLVREGLAAHSAAKRQASTELWAPLSCILLRAAWQSLAECQPAPTAARPPNSPQLVRVDTTEEHSSARPNRARSLTQNSSEEDSWARPNDVHLEQVSSPGEAP